MSDRQPGMNAFLRRAAGKPAPSEAERAEREREEREWAALTPVEKLQRAIEKAAARVRADGGDKEQTR